ncbi:MAG: peptidoglycan-binding domain-containing protein [Rhodanobacter sp.]
MTDSSTLSEKELEALAYFVVGVSSEGSVGGRDVSNRLSFAGNYRDGKMYPVENSGLSIGTLQKDLGQDKQVTATALVQAYQAWAGANHPNMVLTEAQQDQTISDLSRNGRKINDQKNRPLDVEIKGRLDAFLRSDGGKDFVHQRDAGQVDLIYSLALTKLTQTPAYRQASTDDQIKLATVVAKAFNQNNSAGLELLSAMNKNSPEATRVTSLEGVLTYSERFTKSMRDGRDHALKGAEVYTLLRHVSPQHPLHAAWQEVLTDPLITPSLIGQDATRPDFAAEYTTIKNLFLEPMRSKDFIRALEQGRDYQHGLPQATEKSRATSGFFASGIDFVQWNAEGKGFAHLHDEWSVISRDDITRVQQADRSVDLAIQRNGATEPLLHVGPSAPALTHSTRTLRQGMRGEDVDMLQSQLAQLGYTDARDRPLHPDGDFGPTTHAAMQAFQRNHGLVADGVAGPATRAAVGQAVQMTMPSIAQPNAPYLRDAEASDTLSAYRAFAPSNVPGLVPSSITAPDHPQTTTPQAPPPHAVVPSSLDADAIRMLQEQLNTLGVTDMNRQAVNVSGAYDPSTQTAVARYQHEQGLPVTGVADDATRTMLQSQAFIADLSRTTVSVAAPDVSSTRSAEHRPPSQALASAVTRSPVREPSMTDAVRNASEPDSPAPLRTFSDPSHPQHAMYCTLKDILPQGTSEARLTQGTAACHRARITSTNLRGVYVGDTSVSFVGSSPVTLLAQMDISQPAPSVQQAMQHVRHYDQQQVQMLSEIRAHSAQINAQAQQGPTLGGR